MIGGKTMRATLSQIKEQQRRQIAVKDKLVYLEKAPNGEIIDVHLLQWVAEGFVEELRKQADINRQQWFDKVKQEQQGERELLEKRLELIYADLDILRLENETLRHELAVIKGEEE
jgi:hypothetical protein